MAWYRNAEWMASRTTSLPRKLKERFETPPEMWTLGQVRLISAQASMKFSA